MMVREEGSVGIVWVKNEKHGPVRMSLYIYEAGDWGPARENYRDDSKEFQCLRPVLSLLHDPNLTCEAFFFSPEEYKALVGVT